MRTVVYIFALNTVPYRHQSRPRKNLPQTPTTNTTSNHIIIIIIIINPFRNHKCTLPPPSPVQTPHHNSTHPPSLPQIHRSQPATLPQNTQRDMPYFVHRNESNQAHAGAAHICRKRDPGRVLCGSKRRFLKSPTTIFSPPSEKKKNVPSLSRLFTGRTIYDTPFEASKNHMSLPNSLTSTDMSKGKEPQHRDPRTQRKPKPILCRVGVSVLQKMDGTRAGRPDNPEREQRQKP
ncbi:hypothetical protein EJ06DRAFT_46715 [Trichodelitschia bisporula]|uniref:Uncharacterized protein n=1 Tax=Trichodelitschia bisporula TaxID=703511 RepID=A0A6G1HWI4_9PEZI|nr:hypothetical protein EJ06DRAFT_46715 [Trichodelitschia bisporula]